MTTERQCQRCWHFESEHMSPAIDLGLPYNGDVCRYGGCLCREFRAITEPSSRSVSALWAEYDLNERTILTSGEPMHCEAKSHRPVLRATIEQAIRADERARMGK